MVEPIVVYVPGTPRPYEGARFVNGRVIRYKNKVRALYRKQVVTECRLQGRPIHGPVQMKLDLWFATKNVLLLGQPHTHTPDEDNCSKVWKDCAEEAGILADGDSRVARSIVTKTWALKAGAMATFTPFKIEEDED